MSLLLLAILAQAPQIELPEGPATRAWARVTPEALPRESIGSSAVDARAPATWTLWADLLSAEAAATAPDPSRRALLARIALGQARFDDAWGHLAACAASPDRVADLMPRFLPGTRSFDGLADGAILAPALPPRGADAARGRIERRAMTIRGLRVGAATIAMKVSVETEGVQIDVEHLSGGAATVRVKIPEEPDWAFANEYVDWYKQDAMGVAHALTLNPGDEAHTLYARFEPRELAWPTTLPERLPAQIASGVLWLEIAADDPDRGQVDAFARSLEKGPLAVRAEVRAPRRAESDGWTGVVVDLSRAGERTRKLAWLASSVERRSLAR